MKFRHHNPINTDLHATDLLATTGEDRITRTGLPIKSGLFAGQGDEAALSVEECLDADYEWVCRVDGKIQTCYCDTDATDV